MRLIAQHQAAWLRADDVLDLAPYAYAEIIADYRKRWPGRYIDAGIISRLVRHRDLLSPLDTACHSAVCCRAARNGSAGASPASSRMTVGI